MLSLVGFAMAVDFATWQAAHPPSPHPEAGYHFAADVAAELAPLVAERPGVVQAFEVGRSVEDRPIWGFRVHDPARPVERRLLVFANIHALEWVPTEVATAFLHREILDPPPGLELVVIPTLNPDGRAAVEADLLAGRDVYRRGNAHHVDLNRDFAVNREATAVWKALLPRRYATSPAPLSQPETQALDRLAASEHFDVSVSLHAFGGFIYYPWGGRWERTRDQATFQKLGEVMQSGMGAWAYKPKELSRWGFFFRGQGMELDHLYGTYGTYAFLVETTRSGLDPLHPEEWHRPFRLYNPRVPDHHRTMGVGMLTALVQAIEPG